MIDVFTHFYESLNPLGKFLFEFLFVTVFLRGILAHKLASWILRQIAQMDVFEGDILAFIMKRIEGWNIIARKVAIVQHYRHGHEHADIVGCTQENCSMFTEPQVNHVERPLIA